jgi:hypothetical protein
MHEHAPRLRLDCGACELWPSGIHVSEKTFPKENEARRKKSQNRSGQGDNVHKERSRVEILDVKVSNGWYDIIDSSGKRTARISSSRGELLGICSDFVILEKDGWYQTFDATGNRIGRLSDSAGDFKNAVGNSFNLIKGGYVVTYNRSCTKTGRRAE